MAWTPIASIPLKTDWQYTEPVEGAFFRLKHTGFPREGQFQIAQVDTDNTITLSEPLTIESLSDLHSLTLQPPPYFSNRRLAIRKLKQPPTLESQLRNILAPSILKTVEENFFLPRRSAWSVAIEVSDVPIPSQEAAEYSQQFNSLNQQLINASSEIAALSDQLTAIGARVDEINSKIPIEAGGTSSSSSATTLTYASDGDANGLFYYLGTNKKVDAYQNPATTGKIEITQSSYSGYGTPNAIVDRGGGFAHTSDAAGNWIAVDLKTSGTLKCNYYSIRARDENSQNLRSWQFQGSNDGLAWDVLDSKTNQFQFTGNVWLSFPVTSNVAYRHFRILQTGTNQNGSNYLVLNELELYGDLVD